MDWPTKGPREEIDGAAIGEAGAMIEVSFMFGEEPCAIRLWPSEVDRLPLSGIQSFAETAVRNLIGPVTVQLLGLGPDEEGSC